MFSESKFIVNSKSFEVIKSKTLVFYLVIMYLNQNFSLTTTRKAHDFFFTCYTYYIEENDQRYDNLKRQESKL